MGTGGNQVPLTLVAPFCKGTRPHSTDEAQKWKEANIANMLNTYDCGEQRCNELVVKVYGISSDQSHAMLSENPHAGVYEADTSRTLDCSGGSPACNQGGMLVVAPAENPCYCIQGSMIGRKEENGPQGDGINREVASYLNALRKIFVVEDMPAWNPNLRSKTAIRSSDTRYYIDPSIAAAALGIGPNDLVNDLKTFGFLFETLCVRDLRVFADALNGEVYHYRDKEGQECDAVIHLRNGRYGLIEIKLGGDRLIEEGARSLKALEEKIDTDKMYAPSFLMVLTGTGDFAYRRKDGVYVIPIGCLKN